MLKLMVLTLPLLTAPSGEQWPTYAIGSPYALEVHGCQGKEDALRVARAYRNQGAREAWKLMAMGKRLSRDGRRMCLKIEGDFVFTALPVFETEIDPGIGEPQRLSVVHARTAGEKSYWLLVRNSLFVAG